MHAPNYLRQYLSDKPLIIRCFVWFSVVISMLSFCVVFGQAVGLYRPLPSREWVQVGRPFGMAMGVFIAAFGLWMMRKGNDSRQVKMGKIKQIVVFAFGSFLFFWVGTNFVYVTPILCGAVRGTSVEHRYIVSDIPSFSDRRCRKSIELENMPSMLGETCNWPESVRINLKPGDEIFLRGKGNWYGVLPTSISY
jgi:hypothetical protein